MGAFDDILEKFGAALSRVGSADQTAGESMAAFVRSATSSPVDTDRKLRLTNPPPYDPRFSVNDPYAGVNIEADVPAWVKSAARVFGKIAQPDDLGIGPSEMAAPAAMVVSKATLPKFIAAFKQNLAKMEEAWPSIPRNMQGAMAFMYTKNPKLMGLAEVQPEIRGNIPGRIRGYFDPDEKVVRVIVNPGVKTNYTQTLGHEVTHAADYIRHPEYHAEATEARKLLRDAWEVADEHSYLTRKPIFPGSPQDQAIRKAEELVWNTRSEQYARQGGDTADAALRRFHDLVLGGPVESVFPPIVKEP